MSHLIGHLEDDWRRWFDPHGRHERHEGSPAIPGDTIRANPPLPPQEPPVPLTETSAALDADIAASKTGLETALVAGHDVLDNLFAKLEQHAGEVRAVASIADHPAMQAMEKALPVVPAAILEGITTMLNAVIAEHAGSVAADATPGAPADPAQENQAA